LTERLVEKYGVSRELQDEIAFRSHSNALDAWEKGHFADYVVPIEVPSRKGPPKIVSRDENPRKVTLEELARAKPYFKPSGGTITAASSSTLNDGAAAVILASEERARELNLPVLAVLRGFGNVGVPRELMGEGAFKVIPKLLKKTSLSLKDIDFFEINEAFAAVVGAATKDVEGLHMNKINQWGSGIGLGHPVGCTGIRQLVDMIHQLRRRQKKFGMTSRCVGGGIGSGEVVEIV